MILDTKFALFSQILIYDLQNLGINMAIWEKKGAEMTPNPDYQAIIETLSARLSDMNRRLTDVEYEIVSIRNKVLRKIQRRQEEEEEQELQNAQHPKMYGGKSNTKK